VRSLAIIIALAALSCAPPAGAPGRHAAADTTTSAPRAAGSISTIALSGQGTAIALTPDGRRALVTTIRGVLVVDLDAGRVATTIDAGDTPQAIAIDAQGRYAWIADFLSRSVIALDVGANAVAGRIPLAEPRRAVLTPAIALGPDGGRVYVLDTADEDLVVIDTASRRVVRDQYLDLHPGAVAVAPDGRVAYVAGCRLSCIDGDLLVVDAATAAVTRRIHLPSAPYALVLTPDGRRAYVAHGRDASVSIVDLANDTVRSAAVDPHPVAAGRDVGSSLTLSRTSVWRLTDLSKHEPLPVATAR